MYAKVIFPIGLNQSFTYRVPQKLKLQIQPGTLVEVPFQTKKKLGYIIQIDNHNDYQGTLKKIISIADNNLSYNPIYIKYIKWISEYYLCDIGDVIKACLPVSFKPIEKKYTKQYSISQLGINLELSHFDNKPTQRLILSYLRNLKKPQTSQEIQTNIKYSQSSFNQLIKDKYVDIILKEKEKHLIKLFLNSQQLVV